MKCNYCERNAEWVENKVIYGRNYGKSYMIWFCKNCDAYVGCHKNTKEALGTLAKKELRNLRKEAKSLFIKEFLYGEWQVPFRVKKDAYHRLADMIGTKRSETHFGMFNESACQKIISLLK